ncbi:hypothetical protein B0H13DRAFT_2345616 [Mycena leptocephala]|nr:hypothetical protein B0H13DRAFT_2345616 [Mycena leptocephala]
MYFTGPSRTRLLLILRVFTFTDLTPGRIRLGPSLESTVRSALQRCPLLEVLVWLLRDRYRYTPFRYDTSQSLSHITDSRFVQLKLPDHWAEWERGARGFDDYWVEAEAVVAERRANIA